MIIAKRPTFQSRRDEELKQKVQFEISELEVFIPCEI